MTKLKIPTKKNYYKLTLLNKITKKKIDNRKNSNNNNNNKIYAKALQFANKLRTKMRFSVFTFAHSHNSV